MLFNEIIKKKLKRKWTLKDKEFQYIKRVDTQNLICSMIEERNLGYKLVVMLKEF